MGSPSRGQVLYVTYDGLLEPLGASQVLPYVVRLARRGFSMELLSFEKEDDRERPSAVAELKERLARDGVRWSYLPYHKRPTLPATAWDLRAGRAHVARWARDLRREGRRGVLHARGYLPALMGRAGQGGRVSLLFDMRGFWVDERIEGGMWTPSSLPARLARMAEGHLLRTADHLVVLTHRSVARLPELAGGAHPPPYAVIPTCVDLERFRVPENREAARRELGLGAGPVVVHIGSLAGWYDGEATLAAARSFVETTGGTFAIVTREPAVAHALLERAGVTATVTRATPEEMPRWLQAADAGLALVRQSVSGEARYPTKIGEYLASGMAVLATPVGDVAALASGTDALQLLEPGDDPAEAGRRLARATAAEGREEQARTLAEDALGVESGSDTYARVYAGLGLTPGAGS